MEWSVRVTRSPLSPPPDPYARPAVRSVSQPKHLARLNPEQLRAAECTQGPLLVLAGAGTGKTRVITARIAQLLHEGVEPENVLAVTFTNKAALEMRERVSKSVGKRRARKLTISTFHSFCARALRENHAPAGLPERFSICDASDQLAAARSALRELRVPEASLSPRDLMSRVSLAKNRLEDSERLLAQAGDDTDELVGRAWKRYDERLARSGVLDFDDLLLRTLGLLKSDAEVRERLRARFRYVLVDAFQDTNGPQYEILRALCDGHKNLCVVGDDDQSIYAWRGADPTHILGFDKAFAGCTVVRLETNYRSCAPILRAANRVIENNTQRHDKALRSAKGEGAPVVARLLEDGDEEARWVVKDVVGWTRSTERPLGEAAILFRGAAQARAFETELRARAVPYVLVGGQSFFDRKEIRDVLAYLRLLHNPEDEQSFLRVVNAPPRGVGKTSMERALAFATENGISVPEAFDRAEGIEGIQKAAAEAVASFRRTMAAMGVRATEPNAGKDLPRIIRDVLEVVDYRREVDRTYAEPQKQEDRWRAASSLIELAENFVRRKQHPTLERFLEELTLNAEDSKDSEFDSEKLTLMTLHAAKGLEFPRVYLVGMEEGLLPHERAVKEGSEEEERRLAYVGITRAQEDLTLTYAKMRSRYGSKVPVFASRFLYEMRGETPPEGWVAAGSAKNEVQAARKKAKKKKAKGRRRKVYKNL